MNRTALWIGGIAAALVAVVLAPWVMLFFAYIAQDISDRAAARRYQPTSLADAVRWGRATPELVARFIDAGEDVNQRVPAPEPVNSIPLVAEASASGNVEVTRLLLRRGASIDDAHIWYRAREGNEAMARMLIEEGASLGPQRDYQEEIGPELLQAAAFGGEAWLVQLIAQKGGGNVQVVNSSGDGLLALALSPEYHDTVAITRTLLAAGAHVNPLTPEETPPLYWAAYHGKLKELDLLLAAGAHVDAPLAGGVLKEVVLPPGVHIRPLSVAVQNCHHEAAERLLRHGASTSQAAIFDGKSLMEAACYYVLDDEKSKRDRMRALLAKR